MSHVALWLAVAGAGAVVVLALAPLRRRVRYWLRLAKAAATDPRLPRSVRWTFRAALAIKLLPVDFGADELLLLVGAVLLATRHRATWATIREELR